ncbi:Peptidyl-tRNA hydrolase [Spirochaeta thermophila DSM 6578]|uniref:Peptidyl-tRNA hydrolase n=1 Tax=Winmispira thermophila (strain ATCC 700085 / DSM 6578 / Z-1203) TaxID=869211 RepID=G0GDJ3_WINT7|nr:Peptidyl-tRNA hydrolase [Spirochaeta thermophila DSM 6578]
MAPPYYIVGLGNPGRRYALTRHNVGWWTVERIASTHLHAPFKEKALWAEARGTIKGREVVLIKPLTYMNRSGAIFSHLLVDRTWLPWHLVVVCDQVDLTPGNGRLRIGGGHAGHNGLKSIIQHLGSPDFVRYYVGVGRPPEGEDLADYVLSVPPREERERIEETVLRFVEHLPRLIEEEVESVMEVLNRRYY